jgi:hypothetical protein
VDAAHCSTPTLYGRIRARLVSLAQFMHIQDTPSQGIAVAKSGEPPEGLRQINSSQDAQALDCCSPYVLIAQ